MAEAKKNNRETIEDLIKKANLSPKVANKVKKELEKKANKKVAEEKKKKPIIYSLGATKDHFSRKTRQGETPEERQKAKKELNSLKRYSSATEFADKKAEARRNHFMKEELAKEIIRQEKKDKSLTSKISKKVKDMASSLTEKASSVFSRNRKPTTFHQGPSPKKNSRSR